MKGSSFCGKIALYMKKKVSRKLDRSLEKAVAVSSKMEGLSLARAQKNQKIIKLLKQYGRAFSV